DQLAAGGDVEADHDHAAGRLVGVELERGRGPTFAVARDHALGQEGARPDLDVEPPGRAELAAELAIDVEVDLDAGLPGAGAVDDLDTELGVARVDPVHVRAKDQARAAGVGRDRHEGAPDDARGLDGDLRLGAGGRVDRPQHQ